MCCNCFNFLKNAPVACNFFYLFTNFDKAFSKFFIFLVGLHHFLDALNRFVITNKKKRRVQRHEHDAKISIYLASDEDNLKLLPSKNGKKRKRKAKVKCHLKKTFSYIYLL